MRWMWGLDGGLYWGECKVIQLGGVLGGEIKTAEKKDTPYTKYNTHVVMRSTVHIKLEKTYNLQHVRDHLRRRDAAVLLQHLPRRGADAVKRGAVPREGAGRVFGERGWGGGGERVGHWVDGGAGS